MNDDDFSTEKPEEITGAANTFEINFEIIIFLNIKFHKLFNFYLIDEENPEKFFEKLYPFKIICIIQSESDF
jgi:hypothetical protein